MINTRFGAYRILQQIGAGGMASVYKAVDESDSRVVALKMLHSHWAADHELSRRFQREAEIARQLQHRHIVPTYEYGKVGSTPYFTMQYLAAGSLGELLRRPAQLSLSMSAPLLKQIAAGLDYAHRQGIVHRDLKLENILLDDQHRPMLADFGIARAMDATRLTNTGQVTGTPLYMSPEQARGETNLSRSTDIYSLAVMAYLLATGFFPFSGSAPLVLLNQHITMSPPKPSLVNPDLSSAMDAVLLKGLAKKPEDRYSTAGEFARAYAQAARDASTTKVYIVTSRPNPLLPILESQMVAASASTVALGAYKERISAFSLEKDVQLTPALTTLKLANQAPSTQSLLSKETPRRRRKSPLLAVFTSVVVILFMAMAYAVSSNKTPIKAAVLEMTDEVQPDILVDERNDSEETMPLSDTPQASLTPPISNNQETFRAIFQSKIGIHAPIPTGTTIPISESASTATATPTYTPQVSGLAPLTPTRTLSPTVLPRPVNATSSATPTATDIVTSPSLMPPTPIPPTPVPPTPIPPTPIPPTPVPPTPIPPTPVSPTQIPPPPVLPTQPPPPTPPGQGSSSGQGTSSSHRP